MVTIDSIITERAQHFALGDRHGGWVFAADVACCVEPGLGEGRPPANTGNPVTSYSARQAANTGPPGTSYSADPGERAYRGTPITRECPVCGESFAVHPGPGRPQVYCTEKCRWKAGHQADTRARHKLMAEQNRQSYEDLLAWAERQDFREP